MPGYRPLRHAESVEHLGVAERADELSRAGRDEEAALLLEDLIRELEARDGGLPSWPYGRLAFVYRRLHRHADEVELLERYIARQPDEEQAVRFAEWFIARQGYTDAPPVADTQLVVSEGIEWAASIAERLAQRRGSLQPRAFGLCESPDGSFDVAFYMAGGQYARGVTMDAQFGSLRVQHSNFDPAAIAERRHGCRPLSAARP